MAPDWQAVYAKSVEPAWPSLYRNFYIFSLFKIKYRYLGFCRSNPSSHQGKRIGKCFGEAIWSGQLRWNWCWFGAELPERRRPHQFLQLQVLRGCHDESFHCDSALLGGSKEGECLSITLYFHSHRRSTSNRTHWVTKCAMNAWANSARVATRHISVPVKNFFKYENIEKHQRPRLSPILLRDLLGPSPLWCRCQPQPTKPPTIHEAGRANWIWGKFFSLFCTIWF